MFIRIATAFIVVAVTAFTAPVTSYFFGDSLTDTGNVYKVTSTLNQYTFGLLPVFPDTPYYNGRFTNGPVWAEYVAQRLGNPQDAAAAGMSLGIFGQTGGAGNNYAVGGAQTGYGGALGLLDILLPTGISQQVGFYLSRTGGVADPDALYFVMGGGNDLRNAAQIDDPVARMGASLQAAFNLALSIQNLYFAGARNFVLINAPDIGLIPETIADGRTAAGTDAAMFFNSWLALYAAYLPSVPGVSVQHFDLFGLHHEMIAEYGQDALRPCISNLSACGETLFFDSIHPTAWAHERIGNSVADQILGVSAPAMLSRADDVIANPEPSTLVLAASALAGLVVVRRVRSR